MDIAEDDESEWLTIRSVAVQIIDDVDDEGRLPDVSFNSLLKTLSETLNLPLSDKWRPQVKECVQGVINIKKALRQQDLYRDHEAIVRELRKDYYPSLNDDWYIHIYIIDYVVEIMYRYVDIDIDRCILSHSWKKTCKWKLKHFWRGKEMQTSKTN